MAYRAHITIHDPSNTNMRVGRPSVEKFSKATNELVKARLGHVGTRQGVPGLWIERETKTSFQSAIRAIGWAAKAQTLNVRVWTTNIPSQQAVGHYPFEVRHILTVQRG